MATSTAYDDTDTVNFRCSESIITCQICMDIFESPRILPCQHTFCKKCVVSLLTKHCLDDDGVSSKNSFPCPNCRRECKIRQKGKHSIEEHMKCFPESLLLKTLLESVEEKPTSEPGEALGKSSKGHATFSDERNENISQSDASKMKRQSYINILFYLNLLHFLQNECIFHPNVLKTVSKSAFIKFFQELIAIPSLANVLDIWPHPSLAHLDYQNNASDVATILENQTIALVNTFGLNEDTGSKMFIDVQTQTDNNYVNFDFLKKIVKYLLLKNSSLVHWLASYLFGKSSGTKEIDLSLCYTIPYRKIRYWILFIKVFDIFTMMFVSRQTVFCSLILLLVIYIVLLVFFQRFKHYVDGGLYIRNSLPLFPIFPICLNLFSNLNRCFLYFISAIHMNYWLLCKLYMFEFVPELTILFTSIILAFFNKSHLLWQYGPYLEIREYIWVKKCF